MNLEDITVCEISKAEKDKYHMPHTEKEPKLGGQGIKKTGVSEIKKRVPRAL